MQARSTTTSLVINIRPWLACINTVVFFPLFALLLWRVGIKSMDLAGGFGILLSVALSCILFHGNNYQLELKRKSYLYSALLFSLALTALYYFRLNFEFVDIHCPTNLLGFVSQLRRGHFPVSFLAFPEFPANYHAGFPIIAGYLSRWFGVEEYTALRSLSIGALFFVALGIQLFFITLRPSWRFSIGALLFFFCFSFPIRYYFPEIQIPEWCKDTSIFDYFRSNSWPLTDLTLILMLFYFWKRNLNIRNMVSFALYVLLLAILNATVHSLLLITVVLAVTYEIIFISASRQRWFENNYIKIILLIALLFVVRQITHVIPSAFMVGKDYRTIEVGLRFLLKEYFFDMKGYFFQCGLLPWLSLTVAIPLLIQKGTAITRAIAILFLVAWLFPVIFYLKGVTGWDNYHKFLLTAYFAGSILIFITWNQTETKNNNYLIAGIILVLLTSAPNAWYMFKYETSWQPVPAYDADNNDIIQFLKQQPANTHLLPYAKEGYIFCSAYTEVSAASGIFANDGYCYWFFTLSGPVEADFIQRQDWWKTKAGFANAINQLANHNEFIIVKRKYLTDFEQALQKIDSNQQLKRFEFKNFILFKSASNLPSSKRLTTSD